MVNLSKQGQFWDNVLQQPQPIAETLQLIQALVPDDAVQDRNILDAGCGAGGYTAALVKAGARTVSAFDISVGSIRLARKQALASSFAQANLSELPYRSSSFDLIWAWGVLHYVPDPTAALREIARTLKPGGWVVIHTLGHSFWSSVELGSAKMLNKTPNWAQPIILNTGERIVPFISRLITGRRPEEQTSKTVRQKLHERLFVPGTLHTFTPEMLVSGLGSGVITHEAHPPVTDLLKRNMSITVLAQKI